MTLLTQAQDITYLLLPVVHLVLNSATTQKLNYLRLERNKRVESTHRSIMPIPSPFNEPTLRADLPVYPQLVELIRVTAATVPGPSGVAQVAGSSVLGPTLYVAFVQQLRTDSLIPRDRIPVLVDDVNGKGLTPGFYTGRLAGSFSSLPVYEVAPGTAFSGARLTHSVDQTAAAEAYTYLTFDTEEYDTHGYHSTSVNPTRFEILQTGWYYTGMLATFDVAGTGHLVGASVSKNRTVDVCGSQINSGANDPTLTASADVRLTAGDYLEASVYNGHTSGIPIYGDGLAKPLFWIRLLSL